MAIVGPEAIDDAPEGPQRSGGWRREDFLGPARNDGPPGVPTRPAVWGGCRQGKKVDPPPLRHGRSRRSRSFGQIRPSRGRDDRGPSNNRREMRHGGHGDARRWPRSGHSDMLEVSEGMVRHFFRTHASTHGDRTAALVEAGSDWLEPGEGWQALSGRATPSWWALPSISLFGPRRGKVLRCKGAASGSH